jgi:tetratricopeptide (TPR) repeat protein
MSKLPRLALCVLASCIACSGQKRVIRIPESVIANPRSKDEKSRQSLEPYVIKMSDGKRTYQVQIPVNQATGSFSTSIPLDFGEMEMEANLPQTEADREIIDSKKKSGEPTPKEEPGAPPKSRSYLTTLHRVNELFKRKQYELALIDLTKLDREYPDDERVLEMKGTLYWKLRRNKLAREAWERVLALNPNNAVVASALEQLNQDGE